MFLNYGSDDDSDRGDEEDEAPFVTPFVGRQIQFDANESEEEEDEPQAPDYPMDLQLVSAPDYPMDLQFVSETPPLDYGPRDQFQFNWIIFPTSPVCPSERRETFRATEVGPTAEFQTPYDAFVAIWTPEFMQYIVSETNKYAQQTTDKKIREGILGPNSRIASWQDTTVDELYVYFALLMAMGLCFKSDVKEYWSKSEITSSPYFQNYMGYNRFLLLNACLHFNDNSTKNLQALNRNEARIYKIQPVIKHLNEKFQMLYNLNRNVALDESLTLWKGCLAIKQFIKNKAAKAGIKTYEVCESQTGYLWRFEVHSGPKELSPPQDATPVSGVISNLVLELLKGLENKGHTVWMDNYYNSPALARVLKYLGFDCVGTLRANRQGVPTLIKNIKKTDMTVGQMFGCTSGDVDIVVWRDQNRVVPLISTYHGAAVHTETEKTKPTVVHDYNKCMGGVDKKDQMLSAYPIERKRTKVWYKKFFRRLLNVSILNAFILQRNRGMKHRAFRKKLVAQLLETHHKPESARPTVELKHRRGYNYRRDVPTFSEEITSHFPRLYGFIQNTKKNERIRLSCVMCHKRMSTYCPACNVPLCMDDCIIKFHSASQ